MTNKTKGELELYELWSEWVKHLIITPNTFLVLHAGLIMPNKHTILGAHNKKFWRKR